MCYSKLKALANSATPWLVSDANTSDDPHKPECGTRQLEGMLNALTNTLCRPILTRVERLREGASQSL